jgi:hypothetical protein
MLHAERAVAGARIGAILLWIAPPRALGARGSATRGMAPR